MPARRRRSRVPCCPQRTCLSPASRWVGYDSVVHGLADERRVDELLEADDESAPYDEVVRDPDVDRLARGLVGRGVNRYVRPDYIQHNPTAADGSAGLKAL